MPQTRVDEPGPIPYELRIGVTGHCMVESPDALAAAVRTLVREGVVEVLEADSVGGAMSGAPVFGRSRFYRALTWLLSRATAPLGWMGLTDLVVPHAPSRPSRDRRTPVDLTVVTSLAPGSDQIVARAIVQCVQRSEQRNRYLEAVLPIPPGDYVTRIEREEDRDCFRALLALDRGNFNTQPAPTVIHPDFDRETDSEDQRRPPLPLWKAYRDAGHHVVDASELLLAIWDPRRPAQPGGTEDAISYALTKGRMILWLDPSDLGRGGRRLRSLTPTAPGAPARYESEALPTRAKELSRNYHRLAAYNRDPAWDPCSYRRILEREAASLRASAGALPPAVTGTLEQALLPHFVRADQLALRYHALRNFVKVLLPVVSALTITFIAFQIFFLPHRPELAAIEILLILTGYLSYRLSVHEAWHEKWLNDRHLAESLRALLYTGLIPAGAPDDRNLLPFYRPTNDWFTSTLARFGGRLRRMLPRGFDVAEHVGAVCRLVSDGWVGQQVAHHEAVHSREKAAVHRSEAVTVGTLGGILAVAAAHAFGVGHGEHVIAFSRLDLWIAFLTISIPAWGGAFQVIDSMEDHPRMQERAELMASGLFGVRERIAESCTLSELAQRVREARRIIELESEDHAGSMRNRAPEVHV